MITGTGENMNGTTVPQCVEWTIHCLWNGLSTVCGTDYPLSVERAIHCLDTPILDKDGKMTDQSLALANEITAKIEA
ncbi:MAG: hypothetical protein IJ828_08505 [Treponema sp.]|nr:hypothetical protein [Treponema sp.]